MRLSPANFDNFLGRNGDVMQRFGWSKSYACPCINPASGAAKTSCPLCGGKGRQWDAEIIDSAAMTGMSQKRGFATFGTWEPGDALMTLPASAAFYNAGQFDKFRALNSSHLFSETLTQGLNDKIRGPVVTNARGQPAIDRVFWLTMDGTAVIDGDIPGLAPDGVTLAWAAGAVAPPAGVQYSVTYNRFDMFFVYLNLSGVRNSGVSGLPKKLPLRVFDLFGR